MKNRILYFLVFSSFAFYAQEKDSFFPEANRAFEKKEFVDAEYNYRISQSKNPTEVMAVYNLGNAIYRMNQPGEAKYAYAKAIQNAKTKTEKHRAFHNIGNVFMAEKKYKESVEAYKNALRNDPSDQETRYNYALAKQYLKNNPPPSDQQNKNQEKDQENQEKNKGDRDKEEKDKADKKDAKEKKDPSDKDNKGKKPNNEKGNLDDKKDLQSQQGGGISKQRLENILEAVNNEEKKVQEKVNAQKVKSKPVQKEKNW